MKTTKASKTNTRSRIIFFAIALTYNLLLGLYLKDFLVISPMLLTLYLLSALPTLFFVVIMSIFGLAYCSRLLSIMTMVTTIAELMYLGIVDDSSGKDYYTTNIYCVYLNAGDRNFGHRHLP